MAENSVLTFDDNCATNNRISAEVDKNAVQDENRNVTDPININNSPSDNPLNSSDICTQEEAGEEFLAGGSKWNSENDEHLSDADDELLEDEVSLKSDDAQECRTELEVKKNELCENQEIMSDSVFAENDGNSTSESMDKGSKNR